MAPVKPAVPHPNANYPGQPHEEMKKLVTEKYDPNAANQVIDGWGQFGTKFKELATDFSILVNGSQAGWTGKAAEAVRGALGKVGTFADTTGEGFTRTSAAIAQQRDAAVQANKSMPEPVDFNPLGIAKKWAGASIIFPPAMVASPVEMFMKHNEQQEAKAEAVQVMQTRDNTMMSAAMSMPTMESTPQVTNDQGVTQPSSTTHSQSLSNVNTNQRFSNSTGMPNVPTTTPPGSNNGTTNPSWVAPPTNQPTIPPGNTPPGGGQNRPPFTPPGMLPPGMRPPGGGQPGRPGQGGPGMGRGPGGGGAGGGRGMGPGGMGGAAGRAAGSFGPANPGGNAGVMGNGPGGAGAGAGAGSAGRAGAAGAGAGGAGAGAGKGGGEEDKEHKSNYLIPTDEFFDDDRMVAPPVIGG
ncbi:hypothetical protein ABZ345_26620 [Lentzea sp. NPDC005914]|uniref:hypothetical protein n=1 Tax=Lentzea sp. NPDC005914 TaxID=3154572 RepID=UPI0033F9505F